MKFPCRYCKKEHHTLSARLKCECGESLESSMELADKLQREEQIELYHQNEGKLIVTDRRTSSKMQM